MDHIILSRLADQVNFFPSFGFFSQASSLMDTLITATTGAKAGIASTKEAEIGKMLECVTIALQFEVSKQIKLRNAAIKNAEEMGKSEAIDYSLIPKVQYPTIIIEDFLDKENMRGHYVYDILSQVASTKSSGLVYLPNID
jgi:RNA12 protein